MQTIYLKKFGNVLISRSNGREAFQAIRPTLKKDEPITIVFDDITALTPSWFDEFLTHLSDYFGENITLAHTENKSVHAILPVLSEARDDAVARICKQALEAWSRNREN